MADQSRRDRVGLGLIGLGSSWEQLYRDILVRLQSRLTIRLVYDPVEARAKSVAAEFDADVAGSLCQILARPTLQGLLVLDPGWLGAGALTLIARYGKPVYLAIPALRQVTGLRAIPQSVRPSASCLTSDSNADDDWIPELALRFTPSTCRLRELIATKLGPVRRILIECDLAADKAELAHIVDWCANLIGQTTRFSAVRNGESPPKQRIDFTFSPISTTDSLGPITASLQQSANANASHQFSIECERGHAILADRTRIHWNTGSESGQESLDDERCETEILIDQFCRRAVGGLNPVGRLSEFLRAIDLVESLPHSK